MASNLWTKKVKRSFSLFLSQQKQKAKKKRYVCTTERGNNPFVSKTCQEHHAAKFVSLEQEGHSENRKEHTKKKEGKGERRKAAKNKSHRVQQRDEKEWWFVIFRQRPWP